MRLWSLHPKYLDAKGLVAVWREGLLALAVLENKTKGYINHPQLKRFRLQTDPIAALQFFLLEIHKESIFRQYNFNKQKIGIINNKLQAATIAVTTGQIAYETKHLINKLEKRNPNLVKKFDWKDIQINPLFFTIPGTIESWEKPLTKKGIIYA